jgi:uncharacterized phage protein (TIGR01671 family)
MQREIKFRAFDDGKMIYENNITHLSMEDNLILRLAKFMSNIRNDSILMQYTGKKDINNKEIYESDIVKKKSYPYSTFTVEYKNTKFSISDYDCNKLIVIGNIYENGNLLK